MSYPRLKEFLKVAESGKHGEVEHLCKQHPELASDGTGKAALHLIAQTGDMQMAKILISHGAKVDAHAVDTARNNGYEELADFLNSHWPGEQAKG